MIKRYVIVDTSNDLFTVQDRVDFLTTHLLLQTVTLYLLFTLKGFSGIRIIYYKLSFKG